MTVLSGPRALPHPMGGALPLWAQPHKWSPKSHYHSAAADGNRDPDNDNVQFGVPEQATTEDRQVSICSLRKRHGWAMPALAFFLDSLGYRTTSN